MYFVIHQDTSVQIVQITEHGTTGKENVFVKLWLCIISKKKIKVFSHHILDVEFVVGTFGIVDWPEWLLH